MVPPPQAPVNPLGEATTSPSGSTSLKDTPVSAVTGSEFVIVKLSVVVPSTRRLAAPNDLLISGGSITSSVSVAGVLLVAPSLLVSAPAGIVLR